MPARHKYTEGISSAAAGVSDVSIVDSAVVVVNSDATSGPVTGNFTVSNAANWVYVIVYTRWASSADPVWDITLNSVAVSEVDTTDTDQFTPNVWVGKCKAGDTGSLELSIESSAGAWSGLVAVCLEVADAHPSAPDGTPEVISPAATSDAATMTDAITVSAGSLAVLAVAAYGGDTDPFAGNNSTIELEDTASGAGSNDCGIFLGYKLGEDGGALTLGADWSVSDDWSSVLFEIKTAA